MAKIGERSFWRPNFKHDMRATLKLSRVVRVSLSFRLLLKCEISDARISRIVDDNCKRALFVETVSPLSVGRLK